MEFTTEYKSENYYVGRILSSNTYGDYKNLLNYKITKINDLRLI